MPATLVKGQVNISFYKHTAEPAEQHPERGRVRFFTDSNCVLIFDDCTVFNMKYVHVEAGEDPTVLDVMVEKGATSFDIVSPEDGRKALTNGLEPCAREPKPDRPGVIVVP
jgi:hypothetical protein